MKGTLQLAVQATEVAAEAAEEVALGKVESATAATSVAGCLGACNRATLGRGQTTGRTTTIMTACHAHAAKPKSDGKAEAQRQGLQHGRILSLANVNSRVAIPAGRLARPCSLSIVHGIDPRLRSSRDPRRCRLSSESIPPVLVLPSSRPGCPWRATRCIDIRTRSLEYASPFVPTLYDVDHDGRRDQEKQETYTS